MTNPFDLAACFTDDGYIYWPALSSDEALAAFFAITESLYEDLPERQRSAVDFARAGRADAWLAHRARTKGYSVSATANPPTRFIGARASEFPTLADQREEFEAIFDEAAEAQRLSGKRAVGWDKVVADVNSKIP